MKFLAATQFLAAFGFLAGLVNADDPLACPGEVNLAQGKTTTQHPECLQTGHDGSIAVDGTVEKVNQYFSMTGVRANQGAYWGVDLGGEYPIQTIRIHKGSGEHPLTDFTVEIYDATLGGLDGSSWVEIRGKNGISPVSVSSVQNDLCDDVELLLPDGGVTGQFVMIVGPTGKRVSLGEVQVFSSDCSHPDFDGCSHELGIQQAPEFCGCDATSYGDPHVYTFDGLSYDAHSKGSSIYLQSATSYFEIQTLLEHFPNGLPGSPAAINTIAIKGEEENSPKIQVMISEDPNAANTMTTTSLVTSGFGDKCPVKILVDPDGSGYVEQPWGDYSDNGDYNEPHMNITGTGGLPESIIRLDFPGLVNATIKVEKFGMCFFNVWFHLENCECENHHLEMNGILGTPNNEISDEWTERDGTVIPIPTGEYDLWTEPAFLYTRDNWILNCDEADQSIMYYEGSFGDYCVVDEPYDTEMDTLFEGEDSLLDLICGDNIQCHLDGTTLGLGAAEEAVETSADLTVHAVCAEGQIHVMIDFNTDEYAHWDNSLILYQLPTEDAVWNIPGLDPNSHYHYETCLQTTNCYVMMFQDSWGDGFAEGYDLTFAVDYEVIYQDNAFGSGYVEQVGYCPEPEELVCEPHEMKVELTFNTDGWSSTENGYSLLNEKTGEVIWIDPEIENFIQYHKEECLDINSCYKFTFADAWGDGMGGAQGDAAAGLTVSEGGYGIKWVIDGQVIYEDHAFGNAYENEFGDCSTPGPTQGPTPGPTEGPTPGPTPGPTEGPTPGPTSAPSASPTPKPTSPPTEPELVSLVSAQSGDSRTEGGDCVPMGNPITTGSNWGTYCNHDGVGLVTSFPPLDKFNPPDFSFGTLEDVFYNIDAGSDDMKVKFQTLNPFESTMDMYVRFEAPVEGGTGYARETVCEGTPDVGVCDATDESGDAFEAVCIDPTESNPEAHPYAMVTVYFVNHASNNFFDFEENATVDKCCHADGLDAYGVEVVEYTFFVICSCPEATTPARALRGLS